MNIVTLSGTVDSTSTLPTFNSVFPSLIEPSKIMLHDTFSGGAGDLDQKLLEQSDNGQKWQALGISGKNWKVAGGGYAYSATTSRILITTTHKTSSHIYAAIEHSGSSYTGVVCRFADQNNYFMITLSSIGGVRIDKMVGGVTTSQTSAMTFVAGQVYHLGVLCTESEITVYVDNNLILTASDTALSANTGIGLVTSSSSHKVWEFTAS